MPVAYALPAGRACRGSRQDYLLAFHGRRERRSYQQNGSDFNAANAGKIEVEVQFQGDYDEAINKLKSASMGNMGADVV